MSRCASLTGGRSRGRSLVLTAAAVCLSMWGSAWAPAQAQALPASAQDSSVLAGSAVGKALAQQAQNAVDHPENSSVSASGSALGSTLKQRLLSAKSTAQGQAGAVAGASLLHQTQDAQLQNGNALQSAIAQSEVPNGKFLMRDTVDGMPVLPPGMTVKQASEYIGHDWPQKREKTATLFVMISVGMPRLVLENLFKQVRDNQQLRDNTVFVVRGWVNQPHGMQNEVSDFAILQPQTDYRTPVFIDPTWFESLKIHRVPAIVVSNTAHNGVIFGDGLSLVDARNRIDHGKDLGQQFGKTWPIREADALKLFQDAAKKLDLKKWQEHAQDTMWTDLAKKAPALPEVATNLSLLFDPSVTAQHDITLPDGRVVVRAGQKINPLDQPGFAWSTARFIVFDADRPWQVKQAQKWAQEYPGSRILMAAPPSTEQGWVTIEHAFNGTPVRLIEPFVASRLGVQAAPAMVWPDMNRLRIEVKGRPLHEQE